MKRSSGQAIVEFALIFPVLAFGALGCIEAGFLMLAKFDQDRDTQTLADWSAERPGDSSWNAIANDLLAGCDVTVAEGHPGVVEASSRCVYEMRIVPIFDGIPVSSQESAAIRSGEPEPSLDPSPTP